MSDSEDDFASADEGEVQTPTPDTASSKTEKSGSSEKAASKDPPKSKTDNKASAKSETQTQPAAVEKTGKTKQDKKGVTTGKPEASGGTSESSKETETKPKGKKGKQKGKKGKQKETSNKSETSNKPVDTPTEQKPSNDSEKVVEPDSDKVVEEKVSTQSETTESNSETVKPAADNDTEAAESNKDSSSVNTDKQPDIDITSADSPVKATESGEVAMDTQEGAQSDKLTLEQKIELIKSPSSQSISRPPPDHTNQQEQVLDKLASSAKEKTSGGWGWGWGSSLLDVASSSVSTFTNQVGEGFNTMIETVESTLQMPDPEELARQDATVVQDADNDTAKSEKTDADKATNDKTDKSLEEKHEPKSQSVEDESKTEAQSEGGKEADNQSGSGWFSSWGVSNITKMVESTSKNLVTGSLDVLETLGKKTFDVINEHDPGLRKARAFLHDRGDKPNLSAMLRDAKQQEEDRVQHEKESEEARKAHFGSLFDDFQGLAHLEALEMLSNQCEKRVNTLLNALPAETISQLKPQLLMIKQNFEINEEDEEDITEQEFDILVTDILKHLNVGTTAAKLIATRQKIEENFQQNCDTTDKGQIKEIHRVAISSLAEFTSKSIEQFHKAGELILIQKTQNFNFVDCSNMLLNFTKILTAETGILSTKFTECLNKMEGDEEIKVNHVVTNIFLEASNSSSYIQDGFQLLLPVLQQAAIECSQEPAE